MDSKTRCAIAQELANNLGYAGAWPAPELYDAILALGSDAVPALIQVLQEDMEESTLAWSGVVHVTSMLAYLNATAAIPVICEQFLALDDIVLEDLSKVLGAMGAPAVQPCIAMGCDTELSWYQRSMAFEAARMAAAGDAPTLAGIHALMAGHLEELIARAGSLDEDDAEYATSLVSDLAQLKRGDYRALLGRAFKAGIVDDLIIDRKTVRDIYAGRVEPQPLVDARQFVTAHQDNYHDLYAETLNGWKGRAYLVLHAASPQRNDPCWCGSGKGYRQCHLRADAESADALREYCDRLERFASGDFTDEDAE